SVNAELSDPLRGSPPRTQQRHMLGIPNCIARIIYAMPAAIKARVIRTDQSCRPPGSRTIAVSAGSGSPVFALASLTLRSEAGGLVVLGLIASVCVGLATPEAASIRSGKPEAQAMVCAMNHVAANRLSQATNNDMANMYAIAAKSTTLASHNVSNRELRHQAIATHSITTPAAVIYDQIPIPAGIPASGSAGQN